MIEASDDSIELSSVVKREVDHVERRNGWNFFSLSDEVKTFSSDLPSDNFSGWWTSLGGFLLVLSNERHQLSLIINHEHLLHVSQFKAVIRAFSWASDLIANSIHKFFDEEVVGDLGHVLLLLQDLLIAALNEVSFEGDRNLDIDVCVDVFLGD